MSNDILLVFSDTHLTPRPDQRKLDFLLRIIGEADQVVINGDFWDLCLTDFSSFIRAPFWQPLFRLLKEKEATYLYGNHDPETAQGKEHPFSSSQPISLELSQAGQAFHLEHGNHMAPELDELYPWLPGWMRALGTHADNFLTQTLGELYLRRSADLNEQMKAWQQNHLPPDTFLICGHSHYAELSMEPRFANSGSIRGGRASYLVIQNGKPELKRERY
jgi:predicted phosphodiesterase